MRTRARKTIYVVDGFVTDSQAKPIETALMALPYVERVVADVSRGAVTVTHRPDLAAAELVKEAIIGLGYPKVVKG